MPAKKKKKDRRKRSRRIMPHKVLEEKKKKNIVPEKERGIKGKAALKEKDRRINLSA